MKMFVSGNVLGFDEESESNEEEESEISGEENNENEVTLQSEDVFVDPDDIQYSVSSWFHKFKDIMCEMHVIDVNAELIPLFKSNFNIASLTECPILDKLREDLDRAIAKVGGVAYIKNDWHAPQDAVPFSLNQVCKVTNSHDALTYIMFSNILLNDFDKELGTMQFHIAVRPWMDIHPASEFRCIVVNKAVVGITPREWPKYYAHYKDIMPSLLSTVTGMFETHLKSKFEANNFIFDVIFISDHHCILWDISPLNESAILYAFIWPEIKDMIEATPQVRSPVFRYLSQDIGILPANVEYQQHF